MTIALEQGNSFAAQDINERREAFIGYICEHRNDYYRLAYSFMGQEADAMDAISDDHRGAGKASNPP